MCEQLKAGLVSALYVLEIPLLLLSRPHNDVVTVWSERAGAVTNALAALAVTLPAFGWDHFPTMAILGVGSIGTAVAAAASMFQSLVSLPNMLRQAVPACACCACLQVRQEPANVMQHLCIRARALPARLAHERASKACGLAGASLPALCSCRCTRSAPTRHDRRASARFSSMWPSCRMLRTRCMRPRVSGRRETLYIITPRNRRKCILG